MRFAMSAADGGVALACALGRHRVELLRMCTLVERQRATAYPAERSELATLLGGALDAFGAQPASGSFWPRVLRYL